MDLSFEEAPIRQSERGEKNLARDKSVAAELSIISPKNQNRVGKPYAMELD